MHNKVLSAQKTPAKNLTHFLYAHG